MSARFHYVWAWVWGILAVVTYVVAFWGIYPGLDFARWWHGGMLGTLLLMLVAIEYCVGCDKKEEEIIYLDYEGSNGIVIAPKGEQWVGTIGEVEIGPIEMYYYEPVLIRMAYVGEDGKIHTEINEGWL